MQFWKNPEKRYCGTLVATPAHQKCVGEAEQAQNSKLAQKTFGEIMCEKMHVKQRRGEG